MIEAAVAKATAPLQERIAALEAELAKAKKNSSNSSKPPSSDLVKPPKPRREDGQKRQRGGQPGHEQNLRPEFAPEAIDQTVSYTLDRCPDCGGKLKLFERPAEVLQQVEIPAAPAIVTEHRVPGYWCPHCHKYHSAALPKAVEAAGLFGARLTALVAYLKGVCHASYTTIRKFLRDVVGVKVSRGYLVKLIAKVSESLAQSYGELFARLPDEDVLNVDETGHPENRQRLWTWCFRSALETARRRVLWAGTTDVPRTRHAQNLAERFRKHGDAYFRFITTPGIGPTNNLAEQAIRFVVIDRRITR